MLVFKTVSPPASIVVNVTDIPHTSKVETGNFLLTDVQSILRLVKPAGFMHTLSLSLSLQIFTQTSTRHSESTKVTDVCTRTVPSIKTFRTGKHGTPPVSTRPCPRHVHQPGRGFSSLLSICEASIHTAPTCKFKCRPFPSPSPWLPLWKPWFLGLLWGPVLLIQYVGVFYTI